MIISGKKLRAMSRTGLPQDIFLRELIGSERFPTEPEFPRVHHAFPPATSTLRRTPPPLGDCLEQETYLHISPEPDDGQVGLSGFDIRVGRTIARSDVVMDSVKEEDLSDMDVKHLEEGEEFILKPDPDGKKVYYVTSFEKVKHSSDLKLMVDSKSTTGRVGCMSHGVGRRKQGELITIIQPYAFPIKVTCGKTRLSQVTMRYRDTQYMTIEEVVESKKVGMIRRNTDREDKVVLPEGCLNPRGVLMQFRTDTAYRAKRCDEPIDMDARGTLDWTKYFDLIDENSKIILDEKTLYLLGSMGAIDLREVCGFLTREQDVITGTGAWGHFAGVFQPFFRGEITFEVYSYSRRRIQEGDRAGTVTFDKIEGELDVTDYGGDYQGQRAPRLPKMFKID